MTNYLPSSTCTPLHVCHSNAYDILPTQQLSTRFISATSGLLITIPPISVQDWGRVSVPGSLSLHLRVVDDEKGLLWYRFGVVLFVEDSSSRFFLILSFTQTSPLSQGLLWIRLVPSGHYIDRVLVLGVEDLDRLPLVDTIWSVVCLDRLFAPFSLPLPRFP